LLQLSQYSVEILALLRQDKSFYFAKIKRKEEISSSSGLKNPIVDLVCIYIHFIGRAGNPEDGICEEH